MDTKPRHKKIIMWALTYKCNANCDYCYLKNYQQPYPDINEKQYFAIANKIINNLSWKPQAIWLTGGEPTVLDFLPDLIKLFTDNNISVVVNTNSLISNQKLRKILNAKPKGIIVSLDTTLSSKLIKGKARSIIPEKIIEKIKYIAIHKEVETILGTAVVLTLEYAAGLYEYAKQMRGLGVDYMSLNPFHGEECEMKRIAPVFENCISKILDEKIINLPSKFYIDFIQQFYLSNFHNIYPCPALENYFFISPWGFIYPCSNECWQNNDINSYKILEMNDWYQDIIRTKKERSFVDKTNYSECFGARCAGCWKLYYDTIFTEEECQK